MKKLSSWKCCGYALAIFLGGLSSVEAVERAPSLELPVPSTRAPAERPGDGSGLPRSRPAPRLSSADDVDAFVAWAGASTGDQADLVRRNIAEAGKNPAIAEALCARAFDAQRADHSRALVVLSLLGEIRGGPAEECLARFVEQPLPKEGTVVEGEILEQTNLAILQAKAVDGLAFSRTERADGVVLKAISDHESRIVRAEAIAAYLWNHGNSPAARETVARVVRGDERIFLDRVTRAAGDTAETFNPKLERYLGAHPEVRPPKPEQRAVERAPNYRPPPGR